MIVGLQTERVNFPNSDEWVRLRCALSSHRCAKAMEAKEIVGMKAAGEVIADVGVEGFQGILRMLNEGETAAQIADRLNKQQKQLEGGEGSAPTIIDATPTEVDGQPVDDQALVDKERKRYDMDVAAKELVKEWSLKSEDGSPLPVKLEHIRDLDDDTKEWLHDKAWTAMRHHVLKQVKKGNFTQAT